MELNKYIDYTNLKSTSTLKDIEKLCNEAIDNHFETVCVHPYYVSTAKELLKNSTVGITTVVGFPLGMNTTSVKEYEAIDAVNNGADEIDMVVNMGAVKNKDFEYVKNEIEQIRDAIDGHVLKVIIETCYLEKDEIIKLTQICNETFIHFIKTSTGFGTRGVSLEDVMLINEYKSEVLEIKAAGGIKTEEEMIQLVNAGATRIGTSNALEILGKKHICKCENSKEHECHCENHECHCDHDK